MYMDHRSSKVLWRNKLSRIIDPRRKNVVLYLNNKMDNGQMQNSVYLPITEKLI